MDRDEKSPLMKEMAAADKKDCSRVLTHEADGAFSVSLGANATNSETFATSETVANNGEK